jgi:hypothetical protein
MILIKKAFNRLSKEGKSIAISEYLEFNYWINSHWFGRKINNYLIQELKE